MLRAFIDEAGAKLFRNLVDVDPLEKLADSGRADVGEERVVARVLCLLLQIEVLLFRKKHVGFNGLTRTVGHHLVVGNEILLTRIDDDVIRIVDDLLEIAERQVDEIPHRTRKSLEEPDVRDGYGELDVTHALATDAAQGDFDAAAIADHSTVANSLVFTAVAFPVLDRTEDALAEQAVLFGLERAVVDGFGLEHLAPRPPGAEAGHLEPLALL